MQRLYARTSDFKNHFMALAVFSAKPCPKISVFLPQRHWLNSKGLDLFTLRLSLLPFYLISLVPLSACSWQKVLLPAQTTRNKSGIESVWASLREAFLQEVRARRIVIERSIKNQCVLVFPAYRAAVSCFTKELESQLRLAKKPSSEEW